MTSFAHIKRCFDLMDDDVVSASESRESTRELLAHLASIAKPNTGAAKILLVFARMATSACEWLDGDLRVDLVGGKENVVLNVVDDLGVGMSERVFPPMNVPVPLEEFTRALERVSDRLKPLGVVARGKDRVTLGATYEVRKSSLPPPSVKIADDSFFVASARNQVQKQEPMGRAPALPIVTAKVRGASEERVAPRSPSPSTREPSEDMIPVIAPAPRLPSEARVPVAAKAPSEASIPIVRGSTLQARPGPGVRVQAGPRPAARPGPPPIPGVVMPERRAEPKPQPAPAPRKSVAPKKASLPPKKKSIAPPKQPSIAPKKKSIAPPKKSIRPRADEDVDSGWGDD